MKQAPAVPPACTDNGRECLVRTAMLYLDGILAADDAAVPLSPAVRRTHVLAIDRPAGDDLIVAGEAEIRRNIREEQLLFRRDLQLYVDETEHTVVALWRTGTPFPGAVTVTVMNRFRIENGLITELEIISVPRP